MPQITNGNITFEQDYLDWFTEQYGTTEWVVYFPGMDEVTTHDRHYPGDEVGGEPFTEETVREYLTEFDGRFGPGSPMAREVHEPSYAVALHYGVPAFGSHKHRYPLQSSQKWTDRPGDCACGRTWAEVEAALDQAIASETTMESQAVAANPTTDQILANLAAIAREAEAPGTPSPITAGHRDDVATFVQRLTDSLPDVDPATVGRVLAHAADVYGMFATHSNQQPISDEAFVAVWMLGEVGRRMYLGVAEG